LKAGFWLEGDLSADVGGGGKAAANANGSTADPMTWTRRATVSLTGGFGEVRMGRDYVPTFVNSSTYDIWSYQGVSTIANLRGAFLGSGGAGTAVRANNTISYFLPTLGGLYGQVTVAAGEGAQGNKYEGFRFGYAAGPLNASVAYGKTDKVGSATDDLKTISVGGSFNFGFATVLGAYEKSDYATTTLGTYQKLATVAGLIPLGSGTVKLSYTKAGSNVATFQAKLLGLGYVYDLSKRTSLGVGYGRVDNGAGARYTASGNGISTAAFKAGETSTGYDFSINHKF
jgi:predicted porin